jgi:hypothetical protein
MPATSDRIRRPIDDDPTCDAPWCEHQTVDVSVWYAPYGSQGQEDVQELNHATIHHTDSEHPSTAALSCYKPEVHSWFSALATGFKAALSVSAPPLSHEVIDEARRARREIREQRLKEIRERVKARQLEFEFLKNLVERFLHKEGELEETFNSFKEQWREETGHISSVSRKAMHPCYQRIIGLGLQAIPLILQELQERPADWFWALNAITGEDPVHEDDNFDQATQAWLDWGKSKGYLR